jgi:hypothetical protein
VVDELPPLSGDDFMFKHFYTGCHIKFSFSEWQLRISQVMFQELVVYTQFFAELQVWFIRIYAHYSPCQSVDPH